MDAVVIALLLDNFNTIAALEKLKAEEEKKMGKRSVSHVLDPLLAKLVQFTTASDLSARIETLFQVIHALTYTCCMCVYIYACIWLYICTHVFTLCETRVPLIRLCVCSCARVLVLLVC
jgi:hypothetical protein